MRPNASRGPSRAWSRRKRASASSRHPRPPPRSATMAERQHDIVLFGATGFTGGLTAEYLAANADQRTRWALAGRSRQKLEDVRGRLGDAASELPLIEADVNDAESIRALAESTKVVITTVG